MVASVGIYISVQLDYIHRILLNAERNVGENDSIRSIFICSDDNFHRIYWALLCTNNETNMGMVYRSVTIVVKCGYSIVL